MFDCSRLDLLIGLTSSVNTLHTQTTSQSKNISLFCDYMLQIKTVGLMSLQCADIDT